MSDVKDMIRNAFSGNAKEFEDSFNTIMTNKMDDALSAKYDQMFGAQEVGEDELDDEIEVDTPEEELETD